MSFILGITGSIATGKSTVVNIFKQYGFPVVDADIIAREVVEPNTAGLKKVVETFGSSVLCSDGSLNRKQLGQIIFSDTKKRQALNALLAPFLQEAIIEQIKRASAAASLVIADIPLLYEAGYDKYMDQVAVVYIPEDLQVQRLMKRDRITKKEAQKKVASQLSIEEKKKRADIIFDNQESLSSIRQQIFSWLKERQFL
ncbi:dephospho-CoA kinase [Tetragenococcus halophilus]|uniref:Dephospho-CoA kinase n=1 Tax=Tetragenococcus halophilus TaxID=51669 RepID=A0AB35HNJ4_TETHA|nr:dephospho-CoA kinase [Tetragenococcus halophilus]MCO8284008.1 dephospho-CoA kinase [Tetragenococcus halophilus]MCO8285599.1 dephospho-CoA kinase [Tetragenococcus halophilus]MCO8287933.1 dephospho-CoA kinase [Tetragenococcus halophilus]MCO8292398.1 dephospho-CoA kinase [Tetragenococcus halophilus]MCO8297819.1 dephospho-CoA kinase [Tetragenococcus halophilus]